MPFIPTFTQTVIPSNIRAFAPLVKHNNTTNTTLFIDNTFRLGILNTGVSPSISYDNTNKYFDLFSGNTTTFLLSNMNLRPTPTPTPTPSRPPFLPSINLYLNGSYTNLNLRSYYQQQTGDYSQIPVQVNFILQTGVIGSNNVSTPGVETGKWPSGSKITLFISAGTTVAGKGGNGGINTNGGAGGPAINLNYNLTIVNSGIIGGGGGGGGGVGPNPLFNVPQNFYPGGGGAGISAGSGAAGNCTSNSGTTTAGGNGCCQNVPPFITTPACGGKGGNLGVNGASGNKDSFLYKSYSGGAAGKAINLNGYSATVNNINTGVVYGAVS